MFCWVSIENNYLNNKYIVFIFLQSWIYLLHLHFNQTFPDWQNWESDEAKSRYCCIFKMLTFCSTSSSIPRLTLLLKSISKRTTHSIPLIFKENIKIYTLEILLPRKKSKVQMSLFQIHNIRSRCSFNPLSPKSDQHQISPWNINVLSNTLIMRITDMITHHEFAWYFINFSPLLNM